MDKVKKSCNRKPCNGKPRKTREYCTVILIYIFSHKKFVNINLSKWYRKSPHSTVKVEHQKTVLWEIRTMRIKYRNIAQNSTIEKFILVLWEEWIFFKNRTIEKSVLWEDALWGDPLYYFPRQNIIYACHLYTVCIYLEQLSYKYLLHYHSIYSHF